MAMDEPETAAPRKRIVSLDQFRGFAIFSMILVNYFGIFEASPWIVKHHRLGVSFADLVAPLFIFAVGIGFRLSLRRRMATNGPQAAYRHAVRRYLILVGLGILYGGFNFQVSVWDALTHIGCAGLIALPVITRGVWARLGLAVCCLGAYQALYSLTGYGAWVLDHSINGGPAGPLSWAFPLLLGTLVWDAISAGNLRAGMFRCGAWGLGLLALGVAAHISWGDVKPAWPFTQYGMTAPYVLGATGASFLLFATFHVLCDGLGLHLPHLSTLGRNPLVLYLVQAVLVLVCRLTLPHGMFWPWTVFGFLVVYSICYGVAWWMWRTGRTLRI